MKSLKVLIDPGHGGVDVGAPGPGKGESRQQEKDFNLRIAKIIGDHLARNGADVHYTRAGDEAVSITQRSRDVDAVKPDFFLSIHCNSAVSASANGYEVWYATGDAQSRLFASKVNNAIRNVGYGLKSRGMYGDTTNRHGRLGVLHPVQGSKYKCPRILLECGFIQNGKDLLVLRDDKALEKLGIAILQAMK